MQNNQVKKNSTRTPNPGGEPFFYTIKIQGQLDPRRSSWFEGMTLTLIEQDEGRFACTVISGPVVDQPALHGLLTKIRDLNLTLISVQRLFPETGPQEQVPVKPEPTGDQEGSA